MALQKMGLTWQNAEPEKIRRQPDEVPCVRGEHQDNCESLHRTDAKSAIGVDEQFELMRGGSGYDRTWK